MQREGEGMAHLSGCGTFGGGGAVVRRRTMGIRMGGGRGAEDAGVLGVSGGGTVERERAAAADCDVCDDRLHE